MQCCIILWRKMYVFFVKSRKFWAKRSFRFRIIRIKDHSEVKRFNHFKFLHRGFNTVKELSESYIFKNNCNILKNWGFCAPSPFYFPNYFFLCSLAVVATTVVQMPVPLPEQSSYFLMWFLEFTFFFVNACFYEHFFWFGIGDFHQFIYAARSTR